MSPAILILRKFAGFRALMFHGLVLQAEGFESDKVQTRTFGANFDGNPGTLSTFSNPTSALSHPN